MRATSLDDGFVLPPAMTADDVTAGSFVNGQTSLVDGGWSAGMHEDDEQPAAAPDLPTDG